MGAPEYDKMSDADINRLYAQRIGPATTSGAPAQDYHKMSDDEINRLYKERTAGPEPSWRDRAKQAANYELTTGIPEFFKEGGRAREIIEGDPSRSLEIAKAITENPTAQSAIATGIQAAPLVLAIGAHGVQGLMTPEMKPGAQEIGAAAERIGAKPTPGMITNSPVVQGLESSLSQSPSFAGSLVRKDISPVLDSIRSSSMRALSGGAPEESAYSAGNQASKGILATLGEAHQNIQDAYAPFNQEMPKMLPNEADLLKLSKKIVKAGEGSLSLNNDVSGFANKVADRIDNSKSLADLEEIRKQVASAARGAYAKQDYNAYGDLSTIEDHLSNFRDQQFVKLAKQAYPGPGPGGRNIGEEMARQYQMANDAHAHMMQNLKDVGPVLGIRAKNPQSFIEAVANMPPENMAKKLFNTNNQESLMKVKDYFPEEFESLRKYKLGEIYNKSLDAKENIDPNKLVRQFGKLSPEAKQTLFGDHINTINDIKTVISSLPRQIGPSGTPEGELYNQSHSIMQQLGELARLGIYKSMSPPPIGSDMFFANPRASGPFSIGPVGIPNSSPRMSNTIKKRDDLNRIDMSSKGK